MFMYTWFCMFIQLFIFINSLHQRIFYYKKRDSFNLCNKLFISYTLIIEGIAEDNLATSSNYLALISQIQRLSGSLEDFNVFNTREDAVHATSLTLLAKIIATREFITLIIQSTFDLAANLAFVVIVSYVDRANNIFK